MEKKMYEVLVMETRMVAKSVFIEAENEDDAFDQAEQLYDDGEIRFNGKDYEECCMPEVEFEVTQAEQKEMERKCVFENADIYKSGVRQTIKS